MKKITFLAVLFFLVCIVSVNALDLIILRDGNVIEGRVAEISSSEVRYRRADHLTGPIIVIPAANVLSIRYENGRVDTLAPGQGTPQADIPWAAGALIQGGVPLLIQESINRLPAIPIAGNNLKFIFNGEEWTATINGRNFLAGTIEFESTSTGGILTLTQTHIWPGVVGQAAGRVASRIPGAGAAAGVLDTAGRVTGEIIEAVEMTGRVIVLEYTSSPPSLKLLSYNDNSQQIAGGQPPRGQSARTNTDTGDWRNKWVYVGGFIGGGWYNIDRWYYYNYNVGIFTWGAYFALDLTKSAFIFDIETMLFNFAYFDTYYNEPDVSIVFPFLIRMGGRIGNRVELSAGIGYTAGFGLTIAPSIGVNIGPGVLFFTPSFILPPDHYNLKYSMVFIFGYKIGLGERR